MPCKGGECHADGDDARHDGERRADEGGDRDGDGLRDPPDGDEDHDGEEFMRFERQSVDRREEYEQGQQRAAEQADRAAAVKELLRSLDGQGFLVDLVHG